ncbi:oligosaccharyltransferase complex subunit epsilon [Xylographa bjoerkii]|nr:oligosaccharyltransferase complex subunit epsilon [Xylographa bjoerkii]
MAARNHPTLSFNPGLPSIASVTSADLDTRADLPPPSPSIKPRLEAIRYFSQHRGLRPRPIDHLPSLTLIVAFIIAYNMAPKHRSTNTTTPSTAAPTPNTPTASRASNRDGTTVSKGKVTVGNQNMYEIIQGIWGNYLDKTPQRTKLIDVFMAYLVFVGGVQFVYCVVAGNYVSSGAFLFPPPSNAFLRYQATASIS